MGTLSEPFIPSRPLPKVTILYVKQGSNSCRVSQSSPAEPHMNIRWMRKALLIYVNLAGEESIMFTAEQKIRQKLTDDPYGVPYFQHEGTSIKRWITGGIAPDAYVTFRSDALEIVAYCPECHMEQGRFDANYGPGTYRNIEM